MTNFAENVVTRILTFSDIRTPTKSSDLMPRNFYAVWAKSPIANGAGRFSGTVRHTLASHFAVPHGTNVKRDSNARSRDIAPIAAQL